MRTCSDLPAYVYEGIRCNASARAYSNNTPTNDSCVNWNQYYTNCTAGDRNPFQGAISFDNIGFACVAIFQVSLSLSQLTLFRSFHCATRYKFGGINGIHLVWWKLITLYVLPCDYLPNIMIAVLEGVIRTSRVFENFLTFLSMPWQWW